MDFGAIAIRGAYAASPWKWIYVLLGSVTMAYGVAAVFLFPSSPMQAWFLTAREKEIAVRRLATNNTGIHTGRFKWKQVKETFLDPQLYVYGVYSFSFAFVNNAVGRWVQIICCVVPKSRLTSVVLVLEGISCLRLATRTQGLWYSQCRGAQSLSPAWSLLGTPLKFPVFTSS